MTYIYLVFPIAAFILGLLGYVLTKTLWIGSLFTLLASTALFILYSVKVENGYYLPYYLIIFYGCLSLGASILFQWIIERPNKEKSRDI